MSTSISITLVGVLFYVRGIVDSIVDSILIGNVDRILNIKLTSVSLRSTTFALPSVSYVRGIVDRILMLITYMAYNVVFGLLWSPLGSYGP